MKYDAVIFDMGNTLVSYYTRSQWAGILERCIAEVGACLRDNNLMRADPAELPKRVETERGEREDHRVKPLVDRLCRIFQLPPADLSGGTAMEMCRRFLKPIFALGRRYDDVLPTLTELHRRGLRIGILSNTPWGSPGELWREELARFELLKAVDAVVFCTDVGWRKPARQPFEAIMRKLDVSPGRSLFVGDDPRWDVVGPRTVGMDTLLIDRSGSEQFSEQRPIRNLKELFSRLE